MRLPNPAEKKQRNVVLIDEAVVTSNGLNYSIYSALDKGRNEAILRKVYISRNYLTS